MLEAGVTLESRLSGDVSLQLESGGGHPMSTDVGYGVDTVPDGRHLGVSRAKIPHEMSASTLDPAVGRRALGTGRHRLRPASPVVDTW